MSNKERKEIIEVAASFGIELSKKDRFQAVEDESSIVLVNDKPYFFYYEGRIIPTLKILQEKELLKKVVVDMGAVKFVVSGADIMRPGIVSLDDGIKKDEIVCIVDESHNKQIAVGISLFSGSEILRMDKGKVIGNIHWVGDKIWGV